MFHSLVVVVVQFCVTRMFPTKSFLFRAGDVACVVDTAQVLSTVPSDFLPSQE